MTTQISADNIQPSTLASISGGPKISNIQVTNSSYVVLDDTAVALTGGYIKITGSGFASGCTVIINGTAAISVSFISSSELNAQVGPQNAGTYIVYVTNTDGSTAIRVNGITYSGTPTWVTGSTLPPAGVDSEISIQLSATGDTPMTYALQAGSTLPTGLTLTSGGLLSGIITGITVETIYNFTIEAIDPQSQESPRAFSIAITVGDSYWTYVTTLLSASSPTTLPFNDDESTNNFAITINGDTRPYNFNPYTPGYYSNYFDGSGDYLRLPVNAAFNIGSGDYTWECWVNMTTIGTNKMLYSNGMTTGTLGIGLGMSTADRLTVFRNGVAFDFIGSTTIPLKQWVHLAVTKSSGTTKFWINGVNTDTFVTNYTYTNPTDNISIGRRGTNSEDPNGYISNLRLVKGVAVYASNFTPPTSPLTAITNTSLLTCQSNRFIDNSTNNFTITKYGETLVSSFIPYTPNSSYSSYGSTYFDGTGDYLTVPANTAFAFGTQNFTIEAWVNLSVLGNDRSIIDFRSVTNSFGAFYISGSNNTVAFYDGSVTASGTALVANTWNHVAYVRSGTTLYAYLNGSQQWSRTLSTDITSTSSIEIGADFNGSLSMMNGYLSNVRVIKGTALYTDNFTPPTEPLSAIANTSLLTCQSNQPVNNNVFLDSSTNNFLITRAGNATQGTFSPYGENWSNYFDGDYDYLTTPYSTNLFLTGDYTIECWIYPITIPGYRMIITTNDSYFGITATTFEVRMSGSTANQVTGNFTFVPNTWYHLAATRQNGVVKAFVNGVQVGTVNTTVQMFEITGLTIGRWTNSYPSMNFFGYISNVRIIKDTALYTANFTPSTAPLTAVSGTQLLTCQSNRFIDNSTNNFTLTKNGDVSVQKFGPFAGTTLPTPYYSAYFDGSSDWLSFTLGTPLTFGTGDFTIEFWVNHSASITNTTVLYIGDFNQNTGSGAWSVFTSSGFHGSQRLYLAYANSQFPITTINWDPTVGTWYHVAFVRASGTITAYVNGTSVGSGSLTADLGVGSGTCYISRASNDGSIYNLNGYMSNARIVKGTAVYTANFTPPTSPLTAIANTSLLTCQSSTFMDNSTNNFTITANGNSKPTTYSPFTVSYSTKQSYTPAVFGGSMYFDGTGDYLTIPTSSFLAPSNTYTIEFWMNPTAYPGGTNTTSLYQVTNGNTTNFGGLLLEFYATGTIRFSVRPATGGTNVTITATGTVLLNAWTHIAVNVNAGATTIYVNGISAGTGTVVALDGTQTFCSSGYLTNGNTTSQVSYTGYLSDLRVVKGQALYTSNFVPQNNPLTAVKNTTLLLNGTSAGVYDSSEIVNFETAGDAKLSTTTVKFSGSTSVYFDGTGDYLKYKTPQSYIFGTGDFTVEFWVYHNVVGSYAAYINDFSESTGRSVWGVVCTNVLEGGSNKLYFVAGTALVTMGATWVASPNTWYHVAVSRSGSSVRLFVGGTQIGTTFTYSTAIDTTYSSGNFYMGQTNIGGWPLNGYMSDVRVTSGYARYTANFTPPAIPFSTK